MVLFHLIPQTVAYMNDPYKPRLGDDVFFRSKHGEIQAAKIVAVDKLVGEEMPAKVNLIRFSDGSGYIEFHKGVEYGKKKGKFWHSLDELIGESVLESESLTTRS